MANAQFSWLDKIEYPFQSQYFPINNQKLHFIDEGKGETILFVHGTPSWSFDFRNIIKHFKKTYRCVALDHIGFGLSDKPKNYDYSIQNHCKTLTQFIENKKLENIILVVHDFGGPIGLNFTIKNPEKIKGLIVLNSWLWSSENDPDFIKMKKILKSPLLPFLYRYLNFSPRFILPSSFGEKKLSNTLKRQYTKAFANKNERFGALAFAHSLLNDQNWFEQLWQQKNAISQKPTLFVWGMKDPVIKPHLLQKFENGFNNSMTIKLENCGHFPQEESPKEMIEAMTLFFKKMF